MVAAPVEVGRLSLVQPGEFSVGVDQAPSEVAQGLLMLGDGLLGGHSGGLGAPARRPTQFVPLGGGRLQGCLLLCLVAQQLGVA
jgi:hypothetical protein